MVGLHERCFVSGFGGYRAKPLLGSAANAAGQMTAGASLARHQQRWLAAALGGTTAMCASYLGWRVRVATMPRYGQTQTGLVEDAIVIISALAILCNLDRLFDK